MPCSLAEHTLTAVLLSTPPRSPNIPASLSRDLAQSELTPPLMHTLHTKLSSVLSVTADEEHIFSGSQGYDIFVWERYRFTVKTTLRGHTGSVLALELAKEKEWLISSSGDSTVRVWCTKNLTPLYIINPYLDSDSGDLFCLSYSPSLQTVYFGCQNTSLQWFDFASLSETADGTHPYDSDTSPGPLIIRESDIRPGSKRNKFFNDGVASGQATPTLLCRDGVPKPLKVFQVKSANVIDSAHYGYVYSMAMLPSTLEGNVEEENKEMKDVLLVTGSGDETVKLWRCTSSGPDLLHTFDASAGAVLSLVARHETVYAGCQDGHVKVFDLGTKTLVRTIIAQEGVDILSLSMIDSDLYTCSANGRVQQWSASFDCTTSWHAHDGIILSSMITYCKQSDSWRLITGANDNCIKLWHIERPKVRRGFLAVKGKDDSELTANRRSMRDTMLHALAKFVSIPSVSSEPIHREDCRQAAIWLKKCLTQLGAEASLVGPVHESLDNTLILTLHTKLPTEEGRNPLVLATFHGSQSIQNRSRILFYGHYDVIAAPSDGWMSDPFICTGRDGYFYGRGTTDDKGPILAAACAASELLGRRALECDFVFLIEGEEEAGSCGFSDAVQRNKALIGHVDAILVSNSTWISEDRPCITYGLRGVVHCSIEISSGFPDLHSGVEGGAVSEPMFDVIRLLASLSENQRVLIPGFYDSVQPQTDMEGKLYELLSTVTGQSASAFSSKWREPSLSIHSIEISGPGNATVIPASVRAKVSLRIVPDQDLDSIVHSLKVHLLSSFDVIKSPNKIRVNIDNATDWWLGDIAGHWFQALEGAIKDEWGVEPLRIREGGSIPSVPFLEKEFQCRALHLPLGQSSITQSTPRHRSTAEPISKTLQRTMATMAPRVAIVVYSMYGHIAKMAEAVKGGIETAGGSTTIYQIPETLSEDILKLLQAPAKPEYPVISPNDLKNFDAFLFGVPTRYGNFPAQWKAFWDASGSLWGAGALCGKYAAFFVSTGSMGGGQEVTISNAISTLTHHGMLYVPLGYKNTFPQLTNISEVHGGSPWGAGTIAAPDGSRMPNALELEVAHIQGKSFYETLAKVNENEELATRRGAAGSTLHRILSINSIQRPSLRPRHNTTTMSGSANIHRSFAGHLGRLTQDQETTLATFKNELEKAGLYSPATETTNASHDDATALRFLRARKFDVAKAKKQFSDRIKWEKVHNVHELFANFPTEEFENSRRYYPRWTGRRDKQGLPIYVYRLNALTNDIRDEINSVPPERRYERIVVLYEAMSRFVAPLCTYLPHSIAPTPVASVTTIVDLAGVSLRQMWTLRGHLQEASVLANANYPETLGTVVVVNAPPFFSTVWGWIKGWFDEFTREKIYIFGGLKDANTESIRELDALIARDDLPEAYGGKLAWDFFDPPLLDDEAHSAIDTMPKGPWVFMNGKVVRPEEYKGKDREHRVQGPNVDAGGVDGCTTEKVNEEKTRVLDQTQKVETAPVPNVIAEVPEKELERNKPNDALKETEPVTVG
ncbi:hypothetical protein EW145_g494 [Phellinidium pouzarii]|uniref:Peptidase M20 dimerisation domain-containing protein n=1 Tax=Phellinidium pouzarii TaxID=167371 RepID=A0A4V3XDZ8_9AGAM|nr:hypothetical protein EW145_g494 [Phellinidium pouzarii]